jgi:hypothetical protein
MKLFDFNFIAFLDVSHVMVEIAKIRSGCHLENSSDFADRIESILQRAMGISLDVPNDDENIVDNDMDSKSKTTTVC